MARIEPVIVSKLFVNSGQVLDVIHGYPSLLTLFLTDELRVLNTILLKHSVDVFVVVEELAADAGEGEFALVAELL